MEIRILTKDRRLIDLLNSFDPPPKIICIRPEIV